MEILKNEFNFMWLVVKAKKEKAEVKFFNSLCIQFQNSVFFVLFIPYFCLMAFGILVLWLRDFLFIVFFCLVHLALQNINKDYVIFSYFCNFIAKSDQKPKTKNGMNETIKEHIQFLYPICPINEM